MTKYFLNGKEINEGDVISCRGKYEGNAIEYQGTFGGIFKDVLIKAGIIKEKEIKHITREYVLDSFYKRNGFDKKDGFKFLSKLAEISDILLVKLLLKEISMIMLSEYYADTYENSKTLWAISSVDFTIFEFEPDHRMNMENISFFRSSDDALEALKIVFDGEIPNTEC